MFCASLPQRKQGCTVLKTLNPGYQFYCYLCFLYQIIWTNLRVCLKPVWSCDSTPHLTFHGSVATFRMLPDVVHLYFVEISTKNKKKDRRVWRRVLSGLPPSMLQCVFDVLSERLFQDDSRLKMLSDLWESSTFSEFSWGFSFSEMLISYYRAVMVLTPFSELLC